MCVTETVSVFHRIRVDVKRANIGRFRLTKLKLFSKCRVPVCSIPLNAKHETEPNAKKKIGSVFNKFYVVYYCLIQAPIFYCFIAV